MCQAVETERCQDQQHQHLPGVGKKYRMSGATSDTVPQDLCINKVLRQSVCTREYETGSTRKACVIM